MHGNARPPAATTTTRSQPRQPRPYFVRHEFGSASELTTTLVHALSDVTGADVTQAEAGLADHVDPDALNRLFDATADRPGGSTGHVSLTVWDHQVTVYDDGGIAITPPTGAGFA